MLKTRHIRQERMIMAIGERINFFRNMRGMTQKYLGMQVGFPEKSADVRLAQYETGTRTPKTDLRAALADTLDVCKRYSCSSLLARAIALRERSVFSAFVT